MFSAVFGMLVVIRYVITKYIITFAVELYVNAFMIGIEAFVRPYSKGTGSKSV